MGARRDRTGDPFEVEYRFRRADGVYRWHLGRSVCLRDDSSAITGWVGTATDIHDRRLAEERQRFLAEAGWVLGSSLDYEQTLADVARLAVPHVADWCTVDIFVDGKLERLWRWSTSTRLAWRWRASCRRRCWGCRLGRRRGDSCSRSPCSSVTSTTRRSPPSASTSANSRSRAPCAAPVRHGAARWPATRSSASISFVTAESGAEVRRERSRPRRGARTSRRERDRQRAPLRGGRAARPRGAGARGRRRRRRPRRPRGRDPPLEHRRSDDHRPARVRTCSAARSPTSSPAGARSRRGFPSRASRGEPGPRRDGAGRVRRSRALDLRLRASASKRGRSTRSAT